MSEGFNPSNIPTARGRRDPQIQAALLEDDDPMADANEPSDVSYYGLVPGDTVMAKTTFASNTRYGDVWHTYGAQSRVLDGEPEENAFARVAEVVNTRVLDLAGDFVDRIEERAQAAQEEARTNRIPTQRS
jgi:hypothetical protein